MLSQVDQTRLPSFRIGMQHGMQQGMEQGIQQGRQQEARISLDNATGVADSGRKVLLGYQPGPTVGCRYVVESCQRNSRASA
jgi:hypothetical protein